MNWKFRPRSLMDKMRTCGVCDIGSIPIEGTNCLYSSMDTMRASGVLDRGLFPPIYCPHSSKDRTWASEAQNLGSIPGGDTKI